jgi:O-acetyl-ADP-ribose deacetylase (regulator of RNase III)
MPEAVSDDTRVNRTSLRLVKADLTDLDVDAFVFYARSDLALGSGYGTAISVRGGPTIQQELEQLAPVAAGESVVTAAGKLKARHIIHAVGPRFQEEDMEGKLRTTMRNTLARAEEQDIDRLAFPAMGAGYYGIAPELCARVMVEEVKRHVEGETGLEEVIICVLDSRQYTAFQDALATLG